MPAHVDSEKRPAKPGATDVWYRGGLRFACTGCGNCCTGEPGHVFVTRGEIAKIAAFIGRDDAWLTRQHLRRVGLRFSLTEDKGTGDCCFLRQEGGKRVCAIYEVRPLQCRTWPFWKDNLETSDGWVLASLNCPGMNQDKPHDFARIERCRTARRWEDVPE